MAKLVTVSAISGAGMVILGVAVPLVLPAKLPDLVRWGLVGLGVLLLLVAFVLHLVGKRGNGDGGIIQATHGPQSPNFTGPVRDVHFGGGPTAAEIAEEIDRKERLRRAERIEHDLTVSRVVSDMAERARRRPMDVHPHAVLAAAGLPVPEPDCSLKSLVARVYSKIFPEGQGGLLDQVDREVANKVKLNQLSVWGHIGKRPIQLIPLGVWDRGEFDHLKGTFTVVDGYPDPTPTMFSDLWFNQAEVDRIWPHCPTRNRR